MSRFLGLTIQTDVRCASGASVAFFRPEELSACSAVLSPTEPESLTFTIARNDARAAEVFAGRVVRTTFATSADDREWDIVAVEDATASGRLQVTAQPIALRLARVLYQGTNSITGAPEFAFDDAAATIASIVDARVIAACDAAGLTWVERGTIDSTALVDLSGEWTSVLEIIEALAGAGRANGEWQLRRNGDTDYRLDILNAVGSAAATVPLRTRVNLLENRRTREVREIATRVYPRGSADGVERTMAAHLWRVKTVVDATWLELEDLSGGTGPLLYDDQLNGLYLAVLNSHTFSSQVIADSVAATQRVQVASTAGVSAGQWCRVFTGSGANGARVTSLRNPTAAAAPSAGGYGDRARVIDRSAIRGDCNLVPNPWMRDYASPTAAPDNWTVSAGTPANRTIARESTVVRDGAPYSCRLTTTGATTLSIETPDIRPWAIADRRHFAALWFYVDAVPADNASAVIFELITSGGTLIQELARWVRGSSPDLDTWIRFVPEVVDLTAITSAVRLRARIAKTNDASAESGWNIVFGPALLAESELPVTDIEYSGGTKLWQEANRALPQLSQIVRGYDLRVLDLERDDAATFASLALVPGGTVAITDQDLGETVSLRLVEYKPDYLNPLASTIRVGSAARDVAADIGQTGDVPPTPEEDDDALVYTLCEARQTDADDTEIEVTVTASSPSGTPSVRLVALDGSAVLASGAAIGALVPSGSVWTFTRGAIGSGPSQAVFEAVLNDAVTDSDLIVLPEVGRDTVPLTTRARVLSTSATEVVVRVAVADPYPQGPASATITYAATGLSGITPASGQTVTPAATLTEGAGTYADFTIPRPASGAGVGRIVFEANAAGRVTDLDAVDVMPAGLIYAQCEARQTDSSDDEIEVTVTATADNGTPQVRLASISGTAARLTGATVGSLVASGSVWTFSRGAFQDGPSQLVFEAVLAGAVTDADIIEVPEQGRDTVALVCRARVIATTTSDVTVRVAVADPYPPGTSSVSVEYSATGLSGISPTSPQFLTPEATLAEAVGTYVDFTVPRPAAGSGSGRVTFTATASGRVADSDAVDVPAAGLVYAQCEAKITATSATEVTVTVTGTAAVGTPQVKLVSIAGTATRTAGATAGTLVASGSAWTFSRGAFGDGPSQLVFAAEGSGLITDIDLVEVPDQGRDTVPLQVRARVTGASATKVTVRVAVADPYPQGTDSATITYENSGSPGVTPVSGQTVTPAATLTEAASTYIDFQIDRPSAGSAPARVTFTATASGRTTDSDAVDVPAQDLVGPSLSVITTPSGSDFSIQVIYDGTIGYNLDGSTQSVAGWSSPETVVVSRNDYLGAAKVAEFYCTKNGQTVSQTVTIPAKATTGGSITIGAQYADDATDEYEFNWSSSGLPSGTTFDLIFTTTTTSGQVEQDTLNNQTSPVTVPSAFDIGVNPKYQLTINAIKDGVLVLTKSRSGSFLT